MSEPSRYTAGHIILVQEERFRLVTDDGQGLLLTLSHSAGATPEDLCLYHQQNVHVAVEYTGRPNFADGVAKRVSRSGAGPR